MAENHDPKKSIRAHGVLKQQIAAVEAALSGRPLRVPVDAWKRGGGVPGKTTSDLTHYESAYRNAIAGRNRALAGKGITAEQEESHWFRFAYWTTLSMLDLVGMKATNALVERKPEVVQVTVRATVPVQSPPKAPVEAPTTVTLAIQPDSVWLVGDAPKDSLARVMPILNAMCGTESEPISCPTNTSDRVKKEWKTVMWCVTALFTGFTPSEGLGREIAEWATKEGLTERLVWNGPEQKFERRLAS